MKELRAIKVTYSDGSEIIASMASHLTNEEMLNYFSVGKWFNIGSNADNMQQVVKSEILR